ncbi:hypothetical protein DSQ43_01670 [Ureaplasma urealyticum]|nr:hypothetical protein DSQ43_01670 [Ureaplasma urealyticum]
MFEQIFFLASINDKKIIRWLYERYHKIFLKYINEQLHFKFYTLDIEANDLKTVIYEIFLKIFQVSKIKNLNQFIGFVKRQIYFYLVYLLRKALSNKNLVNQLNSNNFENREAISENLDDVRIELNNKFLIHELLEIIYKENLLLYHFTILIIKGYTTNEINKILKINSTKTYYFKSILKKYIKNLL